MCCWIIFFYFSSSKSGIADTISGAKSEIDKKKLFKKYIYIASLINWSTKHLPQNMFQRHCICFKICLKTYPDLPWKGSTLASKIITASKSPEKLATRYIVYCFFYFHTSYLESWLLPKQVKMYLLACVSSLKPLIIKIWSNCTIQLHQFFQ